MTATFACITPMTPDEARQVLADAGLSYPDFLRQFESFDDYMAHLAALDPHLVSASGRAMEVLSKHEWGEIR